MKENKVMNWVKDHRKAVIGTGIGLVGLGVGGYLCYKLGINTGLHEAEGRRILDTFENADNANDIEHQAGCVIASLMSDKDRLIANGGDKDNIPDIDQAVEFLQEWYDIRVNNVR